MLDQAERLKALRRRLDLTQQELADALGIAQSTLSKWESGAMVPATDFHKDLVILEEFAQQTDSTSNLIRDRALRLLKTLRSPR